MQSFLPFPSFKKSAKILDYRRLGKQRIETWQILNILLALKKNPRAKMARQNHPAVKIWAGFEYQLVRYGLEMCEEWIRRGYKDTMRPRFVNILEGIDETFANWNYQEPKFLGDEKFHSSHRAALLFKDSIFYGKFGWKEKPILNYVWSA